jgi:hypothetical protein
VHIFTNSGRSSRPIPIESEGQTAMHAPHWMHRPASITPASSSQNQVLPGASSAPFISSRMLNPAIRGSTSCGGRGWSAGGPTG